MFEKHFHFHTQPFAEHTTAERLWPDDRLTQGLARVRYLTAAGTLGFPRIARAILIGRDAPVLAHTLAEHGVPHEVAGTLDADDWCRYAGHDEENAEGPQHPRIARRSGGPDHHRPHRDAHRANAVQAERREQVWCRA